MYDRITIENGYLVINRFVEESMINGGKYEQNCNRNGQQ